MANFGKSGVSGPMGEYTFAIDDDDFMTTFTNEKGAQYTINSNNILREEDGRKMTFDHHFNGEATVGQYKNDSDPERSYHYTFDRRRDYWKTVTFSTGQGSVTLSQTLSNPETGLIGSRTTLSGGTIIMGIHMTDC